MPAINTFRKRETASAGACERAATRRSPYPRGAPRRVLPKVRKSRVSVEKDIPAIPNQLPAFAGEHAATILGPGAGGSCHWRMCDS